MGAAVAIVAVLVAGCRGAVSAEPSAAPAGPQAGAAALPPDTVDLPASGGAAYPGHGFVVHEWGTNTLVVGSDGKVLRGLHHEEEGLPGFVYDRRQTERVGVVADAKMETPVTYFYSDVPRTVQARVRFPRGVLTQWYPAVRGLWPQVFLGKGDMALDEAYPFTTPECRQQWVRPHDGMLDWGDVAIEAPNVATSLPDAPLGETTWGHARAVAANAVRVQTQEGAQAEKFLFYRGLGNLDLPLSIVASKDGPRGFVGGYRLTNADRESAVGAVFAIQVAFGKGSFTLYPAGVAAGASADVVVPGPKLELDAYVTQLAAAVAAELERAGLYRDESVAMVKTWARQWFRTPGTRLLYLSPEAWTDAQIPLEIEPRPDATKRVMVIRVEAITPNEEDDDVKWVWNANTPDGEAHFLALGRFAEPRLRRALALAPAAADKGAALLHRLESRDVGASTE